MLLSLGLPRDPVVCQFICFFYPPTSPSQLTGKLGFHMRSVRHVGAEWGAACSCVSRGTSVFCNAGMLYAVCGSNHANVSSAVPYMQMES